MTDEARAAIRQRERFHRRLAEKAAAELNEIEQQVAATSDAQLSDAARKVILGGLTRHAEIKATGYVAPRYGTPGVVSHSDIMAAAGRVKGLRRDIDRVRQYDAPADAETA